MSAARVGPDALLPNEFERCIRQMRTFLGPANIDAAKRRMEQINQDANPFRTLVLRETQPWVIAFDDLDRLTAGGRDPLNTNQLTPALRNAAIAGRLLDRLRPTFPDDLADHMRVRLLDLTGRSIPVMMEWEVAHFYLRRGFHLDWLDRNMPGPEFRATRGELTFDVECKRITRASKERLDNRGAVALGTRILVAIDALGLAGQLEVTTPHLVAPSEEDISAALQAAFPRLDDAANGYIDVPGIGQVRANLRQRSAVAPPDLRARMHRQGNESPHDCRSLGATVPFGAPQPTDGLVLWLRGPRWTPEEHRDHVLNTIIGAADQLSGNIPGLVALEFEDVRDTAIFAENPVFSQMARLVFQQEPHVAAILWRCESELVPLPGGAIEQRPVAAVRNGNCRFPEGRDIPLIDAHI